MYGSRDLGIGIVEIQKAIRLAHALAEFDVKFDTGQQLLKRSKVSNNFSRHLWTRRSEFTPTLRIKWRAQDCDRPKVPWLL
jgi:hypothetical protein